MEIHHFKDRKIEIPFVKLLITLKQSDDVADASLQPLIRSKKVDTIYVVRDVPGNTLRKVEYYCPPKLLVNSSITKTIAKLVLMIWVAIVKNPQAILSFQSFPHGINAFICGKICRKPVNVNIMGSPKFWHGRRIFIPVLKSFDVITVTGSRSREYLIDKGFDAKKVYALPAAIDMERFRHRAVEKTYDVLTVARLSSEKNIETLLEAVAIIKKNKDNIKVGILGDGTSRNSLELLSHQLGIEKNVEFLGFRQDTEFYCNSSKIFMLTSTTEGLPMAMLEAMACGLPCIVSNVGDISDAAISGLNAILVNNPHDVNAFADAIIRLLEDDELRKTYTKHALKVRGNYNFAYATEVWDNILNSLVGR